MGGAPRLPVAVLLLIVCWWRCRCFCGLCGEFFGRCGCVWGACDCRRVCVVVARAHGWVGVLCVCVCVCVCVCLCMCMCVCLSYVSVSELTCRRRFVDAVTGSIRSGAPVSMTVKKSQGKGRRRPGTWRRLGANGCAVFASVCVCVSHTPCPAAHDVAAPPVPVKRTARQRSATKTKAGARKENT